MKISYEVWLNARHPLTLESTAAIRVYASEFRLEAEKVAERFAIDHTETIRALKAIRSDAIVNSEVRMPHEVARTERNAERFLKLHSHLLGYVENGGGESVRIGQDDATREFTVTLGPTHRIRSYHGSSLEQAFDLAIEEEGDKS